MAPIRRIAPLIVVLLLAGCGVKTPTGQTGPVSSSDSPDAGTQQTTGSASCTNDSDCTAARPYCTPGGTCSRCQEATCDGGVLWARSWPGGGGPQALSSNGDQVFAGGSLNAPVDFGGGVLGDGDTNAGAWWAELGAGGAHEKSLRLPSSSRAGVESVSSSANGDRLLRGNFFGDIEIAGHTLVEQAQLTTPSSFLALLGADGALRWSWVSNTAAYSLADAALLPDGDTLVGGMVFPGDSVEIGGRKLTSEEANPTGFIARLAPDGVARWARLVSAEIVHVAAMPDGGFVLTGNGPNLEAPDTVPDHTGPVSSYNLHLSRYDGSGALKWSRLLPAPGTNAVKAFEEHRLATGGGGQVAISAGCWGNLQMPGGASLTADFDSVCLLRFDSEGQFTGGSSFQSGTHVAGIGIDPWDRLVAAGTISVIDERLGLTVAPPGDTPWMVAMRPDGTFARAGHIAASANTDVSAMAVDPSGEVVLGGTFSGSLDVGLHSDVEAIWMARFAP